MSLLEKITVKWLNRLCFSFLQITSDSESYPIGLKSVFCLIFGEFFALCQFLIIFSSSMQKSFKQLKKLRKT